jgi:anion-transporting  ArsA/GET3 family ATPase
MTAIAPMTEPTVSCTSARVIVTCGTGGVGKTSCAAALGLIAARAGRRAVVITIDPARRLGDAIGLSGAVSNEPVRVECDAPGQLWVSMLDVRATFDELVRSTSRTESQSAEVLANPFYKGLSQSLSGTRDYMAAARLWSLAHDSRFDLVVVDTPPSRNALDFLESPERLARFLAHPLVRLLVAPGRGGLRIAGAAAQPALRAVGRVVGNDALSGAVSFLRVFGGMEDEFRNRALSVASLLRGSDTSFALIVSPTPDATEGAVAFARELSRMGIELRFVVENRVPPDFGPDVESMYPELAADFRAAEAALTGFATTVAALHPQAGRVRVEEEPEDIHDLAGIGMLADGLTRGIGTGREGGG